MQEAFNEKAVFLVALQLPPSAREEYLRSVCPDHATLERLRAMLRRADKNEPQEAEAEAPRPLGEGSTLGDFTIIRTLGEGGMGVVYLAEEPALSRRVAIKVLKGPFDGGGVLSKFREEARRTAGLSHPGIVKVFRFGFDDDRHYIVSEFVDGPTLQSVIEARRSASDPSETREMDAWRRHAAETVAAVADALDHCHRRGMIHRDVKPSNILIDPEAGPKLTDFGIARHTSDGVRYDQTALIGSCHYMSPEQASAASQTLDRRTDVFSLGVVLYEMLLLRKPFDGKDSYGVMKSVIADPPPRPRSIDRRLPRPLEIVALKALEKNPIYRYQSAAHLAADLRSWLGGDPVLASAPSVARRARQAAVRFRWPLAVGATAVAAASLGAWVYQRSLDPRPRVSVSDLPGQALVLVQRWDDAAGGYGPARRLGRASQGAFRVAPGMSRFTVIIDQSHFAELVRWPTERQTLNLSAPISDLSQVSDAMVLVTPTPAHPADAQAPLPAPFWIDAHEVTNAQYAAFITEVADAKAPPLWNGRVPPPGWELLPVVGVTHDEARAYAEWAGKRLPTSAEWRSAALMAGEGQAPGWAGSAPTTPTTDPEVPSPEELWVAVLDVADPNYRPRPTDPPWEQVRAERIGRILRALTPMPDDTSDPPGLIHLTDNALEWTETPRWISIGQAGRHVVAVMGDRRVRRPAGQPANLGECEALLTRDSRIFVVGFRCARSAAPVATR